MYSVELLRNAKVHGKPHKAGELVNVDNDLLEELKEKGLAGTVEELKKTSRTTKVVGTKDGE
ncbi:hypothetical protein [Lysinibacillus sp.]|uniref:hypothetical protein n=1 Tax=Lysinibacillus sp. TaxID=1869345 RepID=UPI00289D13EF|nr:hypothetical protein [Lysinibacillus sp.]